MFLQKSNKLFSLYITLSYYSVIPKKESIVFILETMLSFSDKKSFSQKYIFA
ncbi:hypothetical protein [Azospirillum melinis]